MTDRPPPGAAPSSGGSTGEQGVTHELHPAESPYSYGESMTQHTELAQHDARVSEGPQ